jgi:PKD repeat protein
VIRRVSSLCAAFAILASWAGAQVEADFAADVLSGTNPLQVQFTDLSTGGPEAWIWDFGDGGSSLEQHPIHTYGSGGPYAVSLSAFDFPQGDTEVKHDYITVTPADLTVAFSSDVIHGIGELSVSFTDLTDPTPSSWLWEFGDGSSSEQQHPSHVFDDAGGSHDVTLHVDLFGQPASRTEPGAVLVAPAPFSGPWELEPEWVSGVRSVDMDGDGLLDIVAELEQVSPPLRWYRNTGGDGPFPLGQTVPTVASVPPGFDAGDWDGDGDVDLVSSTAVGKVALWEADGPGGAFGLKLILDVLSERQMGLADLDGDGDLDLVCGSFLSSTRWYPNLDGLGDMGGPASLQTESLLGQVTFRQAIDLDEDGSLDLVWSSNLSGALAATTWHRNLLGDASQWQSVPILDTRTSDVAFADLDGDGDLDLARVWADVAWHEHQGGVGGFGPPQLLIGAEPVSIEAGDLDGDGDQDLAGQTSQTALGWWRNLDGQGNFSSPLLVDDGTTLTPARRWLATDLDQDGDAELIRGTQGDLSWYGSSLDDWDELEESLEGGAGHPFLSAHGALAPAAQVWLAVEAAVPDATGFRVVGTAALDAPFKGGVMVPLPEAVIPLTVDVHGVHVLLTTWPPDVPAGVELFVQDWFPDPDAIKGFSASNARHSVTVP